MKNIKAFGNYFKSKRIGLKMTLRQFCSDNGFDPGNISRLERGIAAHPVDESILKLYAKALKIKKSSDYWNKFFDMARASKGIIPPDLMEEEVVQRLPLVFRTIRGKKLSKDKLKKLIKLIEKS